MPRFCEKIRGKNPKYFAKIHQKEPNFENTRPIFVENDRENILTKCVKQGVTLSIEGQFKLRLHSPLSSYFMAIYLSISLYIQLFISKCCAFPPFSTPTPLTLRQTAKKQTYFFLFFLFWKSVLIIIRNLKKNTDFYYFENSCKINNFIQMPVCKGTLKNIYGQLIKELSFCNKL